MEGNLTAELLGPCPFCGKNVFISMESCGVIHELPMCPKFEAMDAMTFVRSMRMATVGPMPDDEEWPMPVEQKLS